MASAREQLPLISVVVPSYNQGHFLPDTFETIFNQAYPYLEVIVIDGGSTDASVDIIRRYESRIKFWRSERDGGQSAAINEGMSHCSGDVIAWLNSDDFYHGDCLWTVGKAFNRYPGRGLYIGNGLRFDQATKEYKPFNSRHIAMDRLALRRGADFLLQPSVFFLREAWQKVGGLDEQLRYCMDWDIFIRIADLYPCVLINEFLGVSREYEETKTRSGKLERVFEIMRMIRRHTQLDATPGGMLYLLETLAGLGELEGVSDAVRGNLHSAFSNIVGDHCRRHGRGLWFPARTDPQDDAYLPVSRDGVFAADPTKRMPVPTISVIVSENGKRDYLEKTVQSIAGQGYRSLELAIAAPGMAAADAAMRRSRGEVLVWAEAGDAFADGALCAAGSCFAKDAGLDLLYGNALHIDENDQLFLADHGLLDSAFWMGVLPQKQIAADFHFEIYKAPRPAVYFSRRLLEKCGGPDPDVSEHYGDAHLFRRFALAGRCLKLERTLAMCRLTAATYAADRVAMLGELYEFERPYWPRLTDSSYRRVLRRFVGNYMRWKFHNEPNRRLYLASAVFTALSAVIRIGNPMRWWPARDIAPGDRWEQLKFPAEKPAERVAA
jgi:GT2 family glycosyltransferase